MLTDEERRVWKRVQSNQKSARFAPWVVFGVAALRVTGRLIQVRLLATSCHLTNDELWALFRTASGTSFAQSYTSFDMRIVLEMVRAMAMSMFTVLSSSPLFCIP
jgi:hypothetical protein